MQWFGSSGGSSSEGKKKRIPIKTVSSLFLNIGLRRINLFRRLWSTILLEHMGLCYSLLFPFLDMNSTACNIFHLHPENRIFY